MTSQLNILKMGMPLALILGAIAIGAILIAIWRREVRLRGQRELLRRAYELGEEILGASTTEQILINVRLVAPKIFGVTHVELYLYNRHAKTLDAVDGSGCRFDSAGGSAGRSAGGRRGLLPLPDLAGHSGYVPQPVSGSGRTWRRAAIAAVRTHAGAGRGGGCYRDAPARPRPGFQPR